MIQIASVEAASLHIASFRKQFHFKSGDNQNYFDQVIKDAKKEYTKIHMLEVGGVLMGFMALSVQCMKKQDKRKYLNIDYIFVNDQYRQKHVKGYGKKASEVMIEGAIRMALEIKNTVPLAFIAAEPAHDRLFPLYLQSGFNQLQGTQNTFFLPLK